MLLVGTVAVAASAILAWMNARFVAQRIERLATSIAPDAAGTPDELDRIARGVDRLSTDVQIAEADRVDRERLLVERTRDYARLLASIADDTAGRLDEVRLPCTFSSRTGSGI